MALEPGPMQVVHNFHTTKEEVLDDIKKLDLWPTVYVSERMEVNCRCTGTTSTIAAMSWKAKATF